MKKYLATERPWIIDKGTNGFCKTWQVSFESTQRALTIADCGSIENKVFKGSTDNYSHTEENLENKANAELIVRAVNNFDALLQACKDQLEYLKEFNWKAGHKPETMIMLETAIANAEK